MTKKKLLTEREAWLLLAKWWSGKLSTDIDGSPYVKEFGFRSYGVCASIACLESSAGLRLGAQGNAVVPQVADWIGRRIMENLHQ